MIDLLRPKVRYSGFYEGNNVVHFVGGKMTNDLLENLDGIADWVLDNDITILWGDNYQEKANEKHPVAALIKRVNERAKERKITPNNPIRILQIGNHFDVLKQAYEEYFNYPQFGGDKRKIYSDDIALGATLKRILEENKGKHTTQLVKVVDDEGQLLGYYDDAISDEITIYTAKQQDRQKLYYYGDANDAQYKDTIRAKNREKKDGVKGKVNYFNNTTGLFVLPGGAGCASEIANAFIYAMGSGDLPTHFSIHVIDNEDGSYKDYIDAFLKLTGNNPACKKFLLGGYYKTAKDFVSANLFENNDGLNV